MVYYVIGLMSGSSLDGLDIAFVQLEEVRGKWSHQVIAAECKPYPTEWSDKLKNASGLSVPEFLELNTAFGRYLGEQINDFVEQQNLHHKVHFIASHGHTVYHNPANSTSVQIGDGASITALTGLPVITDLRSVDVALGGQGAPIVPIGDELLFQDYPLLLNIGGIANITIRSNGILHAFDICPANQVLNKLAQEAGQPFDKDGTIAAGGQLISELLQQLDENAYYQLAGPKSLSNEAAMEIAIPALSPASGSVSDRLYTVVKHIAGQIKLAVQTHAVGLEAAQMLVTGGGALNGFLVEQIATALEETGVQVVVPDPLTVEFKEAIVMALFGALRWREEINVYGSATGASRDSIGGALWISG